MILIVEIGPGNGSDFISFLSYEDVTGKREEEEIKNNFLAAVR